MDKLKMHSPDLTQRNIDAIADLFPTVITESIDADGNQVRAVDFDALRQELSDHVVEGPQERYQLDWPGKRAAAFAANAPIAKTLRPVRGASVEFDTTRNLFIEGDNLEALKLLQESYLGKVKLIYIDPPYNTGNDFVYEDDFAESSADYLARSGQKSETGDRLVANAETNGRFHSDWLSMMYSRLKLARSLLTTDGVLAISIDDHEVARLRALGDELFGRGALLGALTWRRRPTADSRNFSRVSTDHEYVLLYGRSETARVKGRGIDESKYRNPDGDPRGPWTSENLTGLAGASARPNLHYDLVNPETGIRYPPSSSRGWAKAKETTDRLIAEERILWPSSPTGRPREKKFLGELQASVTGLSTWVLSDEVGYNYAGTREVRDLFGDKVFDFPKPVALLQMLVEQVTSADDIVMDFFAGSGSTGHAVLAQNAADGGTRRFILIQIAEPTDGSSNAYKAGYKSIADIARRRVALAACNIQDERSSRLVRDNPPLDTGFRALTVDTSNMATVASSPDRLAQASLESVIDSVKPGRTSEDLLFQVLLDWGLDLTEPISTEAIDGRDVLAVADDALIACFADEVTDDIVEAIAKRHPLRAVFLDAGFATDAARINAEQIFREASPETDVRAI
ncbi:site-specific DNA-methyltransferase [Tessaracoccus sp. SD287]|nr:site-specific DNA-methyltransferase [Tessaracoccus sp. SD287]